MAWTQATINNLKPIDKAYWRSEDRLAIKVEPSGHIGYYCFIRRKHEFLGVHPTLTLRNAKKKKDTLYAEMYMGKLEESKATFMQFVNSQDFLDWSKTRTTHQARVNSMNATILPILGKVKLAKLSTLDITRYKNKRKADGVAESTINRELNDISAVLSKAKEFELIREKIKVEKYKDDTGKERRILEDWEVKALRKSARSIKRLNKRQIQQKKHIPLVIDIGLFCGLRRGEILNLTWGDIVDKGHFQKQFIEQSMTNIVITDEGVEQPDMEAWKETIYSDFAFSVRGTTTKTKQSRLTPIAKELAKELHEYYREAMLESSDEDFNKWMEWMKVSSEQSVERNKVSNVLNIHPDHRDRRIFPFKKVTNSFNTARNNAGIDKEITLHSLRHHFCTKALESGMSLHCVKDLAGHASITTTERYLHANPKIKFEQYQKFEKLMMKEISA